MKTIQEKGEVSYLPFAAEADDNEEDEESESPKKRKRKKESRISLEQERLIRSIVRDELILDMQFEQLILEQQDGGMDMIKDVLQFLIAGAAEYGLGAITMPAGGAGLVVGPTVETVIDVLFVAEEVMGVVDSIKNFAGEISEFKDLVMDAIDSFGSITLEAYYKKLIKIVQSGVALLGEGGAEGLESIVERIKEAINEVISKAAQGIKQGLKTIIPDATAGAAVGLAAENLLKQLAESAYSLMVDVLNSDPTGLIKGFVENPGAAFDWFQHILDEIKRILREASEIEMNWETLMDPKMTMIAAVGGPAMKKMADMLEGFEPKVMGLLDGVLNVLMPAVISCLGIYQILMQDEWRTEAGKKAEEEKPGLIKKIEGDPEEEEFKLFPIKEIYVTRSDIKTLVEDFLSINSRANLLK